MVSKDATINPCPHFKRAPALKNIKRAGQRLPVHPGYNVKKKKKKKKTSTFPSCWKYVYKQPVPKKSDRSNPLSYRPIALLSCLSKAFETILNKWFLKHLSTFNLLSDHQNGFRMERSTGDLLAFLTDSWSSCLSRFGETFAVALDISKAFDRTWHRSLVSKLPSCGINASLCTFISNFISGRSILAVVDGYCSKPKPIISGLPQGSVLSPTLFLLFIKDFLSITDCPIDSYADDSTLQHSITFKRRPSQIELHNARLDATERLASDLSIISDWGRRNLVSFSASKTQFLHLSTRHYLPDTYPLFFDNTRLSSFSTLNILGLSLSNDLNWKFHISSLSKSDSAKFGVLYRLRQHFSLSQMLTIYKGLIRPCMENVSHVWGGSTHTALLNRVEFKAFRLINSPPLTDSILPLNLRSSVASLSIFYRYLHANCSSELANCKPPLLPRPRCTKLTSQAHPSTVQILYGRVDQHLHSFIPVTGKLWNNLPLSTFPPSYDLNFFQKGSVKAPLDSELIMPLDNSLNCLFFLWSVGELAFFSLFLLCP